MLPGNARGGGTGANGNSSRGGSHGEHPAGAEGIDAGRGGPSRVGVVGVKGGDGSSTIDDHRKSGDGREIDGHGLALAARFIHF